MFILKILVRIIIVIIKILKQILSWYSQSLLKMEKEKAGAYGSYLDNGSEASTSNYILTTHRDYYCLL